MTIIIFIIILAVLVFVHELGHFLIAKASGIRVDEFGLGFPPRLWGKKIGETTYTLNAVPFGGFVKIFGEDPDEVSMSGPDSKRSIVNKPKWIQIAVLVAGIGFNIIFAWILISIGFMIGLPSSTSAYPGEQLQNAKTVITYVAPNSPAEKAGLKVGDTIEGVIANNQTTNELSAQSLHDFIGSHSDQPIVFSWSRGDQTYTEPIKPQPGLGENNTPAVGIKMDDIGILHLSFFKALYEGAHLTILLVKDTAVTLAQFIYTAFVGKAHLSDVTGPVGIAGMVGDAARLGFIYILSFTALISINLAIINLIPFPALDGGRVLFVIIEAIKGSPIKPTVANTINAVGFALLIILMLVVTYHDIFKLFVK